MIHIRRDSAEPISMQIAGQIRANIANGALRENDRLPAARELARTLGINIHTVLTAYHALRDSGYINMRRGRQARVSCYDTAAQHELRVRIQALAREARKRGVTKEEALSWIREGWI